MENLREMRVRIEAGLDADGIKDALNDGDEHGHESELMFEVAHAVLEHGDDRAQVDAVVVDSVTVDPEHPSQVHLEFTISWSAHYGCRDMNAADEEHVDETATYSPEGDLIFLVPGARRPANYC